MKQDLPWLIGLVAIVGVILLITVVLPYLRQKKQSASTCGDTACPGGTNDPSNWYLGPVLTPDMGGDHSVGMPLHPSVTPDGWLYVDLPQIGSGSKLDYVTWKNGPLTGFARLRLQTRLESSDPTAEFLAVPEGDNGHYKARITPVIIEEGEDWTAAGDDEPRRWYHEDPSLDYLQRGQQEFVAPLDDNIWTGTLYSTLNPADKGGIGPDGSQLPKYNPDGFKAAIDNTCCVGFVLGGDSQGIGHGTAATGPMRLYWRMTAERA